MTTHLTGVLSRLVQRAVATSTQMPHTKKKEGEEIKLCRKHTRKNERQSVNWLDNGVFKKAGESSDGTSKT